GDAGEDKTENAPADGEEDDDDLQTISSFDYYHPRSAPMTPENQADQPYPSIETESQRTATTPYRSPLTVSPRTDMYMRSRRYTGPTYMQPRERSYIHKPKATPITTTPSEIRRRHPQSSPVKGDQRKRSGDNDDDDDGGRSEARSKRMRFGGRLEARSGSRKG
ncbi:hypothetical protein IMZ48_12380, partial [Candidatus Bathyarchaeota archaeon]|nr:hypothetical protein [Candidatus Bathyarchaeota archaeon]